MTVHKPLVIYPRKKFSNHLDFSLIFISYILPATNLYRLFKTCVFYSPFPFPLLMPQFRPHNLFPGLRVYPSLMITTVHALCCCQTDPSKWNTAYIAVCIPYREEKFLLFFSVQRNLCPASDKEYTNQVISV